MLVHDICGRPWGCAASRRTRWDTSAPTSVVPTNAMGLITKGPCGAGCWAHSYVRTTACTAISHRPAPISTASARTCATRASARSAKSSTAIRRSPPRAASPRRGALPKFFEHGESCMNAKLSSRAAAKHAAVQQQPEGSSLTAEQQRLQECTATQPAWKKWGPYLSERQWGTVREDYSPHGNAWEHFP